MDLFTEVLDAQVIAASRGVYKQPKLYSRGADLYAGMGSGFVRLLSYGTTSAPNVKWIGINKGDDGYMPGSRAPKLEDL